MDDRKEYANKLIEAGSLLHDLVKKDQESYRMINSFFGFDDYPSKEKLGNKEILYKKLLLQLEIGEIKE